MSRLLLTLRLDAVSVLGAGRQQTSAPLLNHLCRLMGPGEWWHAISLKRPQYPWGRAPFRAIGFLFVRSIVMYITLVLNVVSMLSLIVGVLLHSGQGGGLSDMFGGASGAALGSAAAERNLNRITTVFATIWLFTVIALSFLLN